MKLKKAVKLANSHKIKSVKTPKKYKKKSQKFFKKNGFHFEECWNLDLSIACFILPRLVQLKKVGRSYPQDLTEKEWNAILDKMIHGFEIIVKEEIISDSEKLFTAQEAVDLFAKYYFSLWD